MVQTSDIYQLLTQVFPDYKHILVERIFLLVTPNALDFFKLTGIITHN